MQNREEFLAKVLETHREYEEATVVIRKLMRGGLAAGPEWLAAAARQVHALNVWSTLPGEYSNFHSDGGR